MGNHHITSLQRGMGTRLSLFRPGLLATESETDETQLENRKRHIGLRRIAFHHGQHGKPGRICPEQQPEGLWRHLRQRPGHHAKRHAPGECSPYGIRARFHTHCQLQLRAQGQGPCPRMFQDRIACHVLVQPAPDPFDDPVSRGRRLRLHERRAADRDRRPSHAPFPGRHVDLRFTKSLPKYVRRFGTGKSLCLHRPAPESIPVDPARVDLTQLLGNKRRFRGRGHLRRDRRHLLHDDFRHPISQNTQQIIYHRSTTSLKKQKSSIPNDLTSNYFVFLRNLFKQTIKPLFLIMKTNLYLVAAALTFLAKTFVQDVGTLMHKQISIPLALQPITFLYYAVFGALLLLGTLNIVPWLDVYHFDPLFENLIVLGVIAVMIYSDMLMGIFLALASVALFFTNTHNILDNIFCPYLWVYSVGYTLFMSFISLRKYYEKRILV